MLRMIDRMRPQHYSAEKSMSASASLNLLKLGFLYRVGFIARITRRKLFGQFDGRASEIKWTGSRPKRKLIQHTTCPAGYQP